MVAEPAGCRTSPPGNRIPVVSCPPPSPLLLAGLGFWLCAPGKPASPLLTRRFVRSQPPERGVGGGCGSGHKGVVAVCETDGFHSQSLRPAKERDGLYIYVCVCIYTYPHIYIYYAIYTIGTIPTLRPISVAPHHPHVLPPSPSPLAQPLPPLPSLTPPFPHISPPPSGTPACTNSGAGRPHLPGVLAIGPHRRSTVIHRRASARPSQDLFGLGGGRWCLGGGWVALFWVPSRE